METKYTNDGHHPRCRTLGQRLDWDCFARAQKPARLVRIHARTRRRGRATTRLRFRPIAHAHSSRHVPAALATQQLQGQPVFLACPERLRESLPRTQARAVRPHRRLHAGPRAADASARAAIAVAGFVEPELLAHLHAMARPTVLIDLRVLGFRSVNIDNVKGASLAMQHLFESGRRCVAFIGGSLAHYSIAQRALSYRKAYFDAGLLFDPTLEITARPAGRSRRRHGTPDR